MSLQTNAINFLPNKGELLFITGCMFSRKSEELIRNVEILKKHNIKFFAVKPYIHDRDGDFIKSRAIKKTVNCILIKNPMDLVGRKEQFIIIDEYQFFPKHELDTALKKLLKEKKQIIISGLDKISTGDYWENYEIVKEKATRVIELSAKCSICGKPARWTRMISTSNDIIQIEGTRKNLKFEPLCTEHFYHIRKREMSKISRKN